MGLTINNAIMTEHISITEAGDSRFYDGLPSVTTVLDVIHEPWLTRWRGRVGNEEADRIANEAAWMGSRIHDLLAVRGILILDEFYLVEPDPDVGMAVNSYSEWESRHVDKWLYIEQSFRSARFGIGGTPDRIGHIKGDPSNNLTLVDLKTTNQPSIKHRFQTAGYKLILRDNGIDISRRLVLYLPTSRSDRKIISVKEHTNDDVDDAAILACITLYNAMKG